MYVSINLHNVVCQLNLSPEQEDISPSTHNMDVPNVNRNEYALVDTTCLEFVQHNLIAFFFLGKH